MDRNQLTEEIIKNLITIQNKLKNDIVKKTIVDNIKYESFKYENLISAVNYYIKNKEGLTLLSDSLYLNQFNNSLRTFILKTENENEIIRYKVQLLDAINVIIDYQNILFSIEEKNLKPDEKDFSERYYKEEDSTNESENSILKSKIEDLEKKNFEVLGQFSELKNLFEKRETEFAQVSEVLEKSKTLESEFENAKEAVLKNIELKQATTYWEKQTEKYNKKYLIYFGINIFIAICLIATTFYLINHTGLFITNTTDLIGKELPDAITKIAHSASFFNYIIFIMFTTIMVWMMKILVKIMLSNYHLAVDANERVIMINTYLVLLEDGKGFQETDRKVILDNIFRQTNHGIIKDETSVTVADIVSSFKR
ncbi:DUF6161 domain-containing protein [Arcobacter cloacae]|uniref:Uncharacterized protein n=1 Tax=Arcobacter cloacae TaxID=1054034 RepID=A0A6M8NJQ3_9BACT|nr:DUF6161 domain-containing protein [Arcobacter cloacae]QKF90121.1 putative membrane protein [Arcobacter cloacae]RXI38217.1 hypothetical protein CP963_11685 [Arcobacter cloacae]